MNDSITRMNRLAAYAALAAGGVTTAAQADIQIYEGKPIPLDVTGGITTLSMGGVEFGILAQESSFSNQMQSSFLNCCGNSTTTWGATFCTDYRTTGFQSVTQAFSLNLAGCGTDVASMIFQELGDAVGSGGCVDNTFICANSFRSFRNCSGSSSTSSQGCLEDQVRYTGFTVTAGGNVYEGWAEIQTTGSGSYQITRWAYQDDGGDITVGEEPAAECRADINGDGKVDAADLGLLLGAWGDCE